MIKRFLVLLSSVLLSSCMVGPNYKRSCPPKLKSYSDIKTIKKIMASDPEENDSQLLIANRDIPSEWWKLFQSKSLNQLIKKGLKHNPTFEAAKASLRQAQENVTAYVGSNFYPGVTGQLSGQREIIAGARTGLPNPNDLKSIFNLYNATVDVSYTLDFFGANRRTLEGLCAQIDYQKYQVMASYLSLTSNIVTTAITEASLREQIQATEQLIQLNLDQLKITQQKFKLGAASRAEVLIQEAQLANIRATLPPLIKNLASTRYALSALIGEFPTENKHPRFYLTELVLPKEIPVSCPSKLLLQRPDIQASEALLHQASANIGVATANFYPQINLTGSYGPLANTINDLFKRHSMIWNYGGQLLQPLFQGGALRAQRRGAIAAYEQAKSQYQETLLQAFRNVADTLRALQIDADTLKLTFEAERASKASLDLVKQQYQLGAVDYVTLLNTQQQFQTAVINRIQAQAMRYTDTAALFQALGGGWWNQHDTNL